MCHAGASFPRVRIAQETKLTKNRLESLALQHELLAFSGFAGLRLFAASVKLDQAYPPLKSRALRTQNSLRTIGWSEVSNVKVTISCSDGRLVQADGITEEERKILNCRVVQTRRNNYWKEPRFLKTPGEQSDSKSSSAKRERLVHGRTAVRYVRPRSAGAAERVDVIAEQLRKRQTGTHVAI